METEQKEMLDCRFHAEQIARQASAAYWLYGRDDSTAKFLRDGAHESFVALAFSMGYTITRNPDVTADEVAS